MNTLNIILRITGILLLFVTVIVLVAVLPSEGKTVEYRLESSFNDKIGSYPVVRQVIENSLDSYSHHPELSMEEGQKLVNKLNKSL